MTNWQKIVVLFVACTLVTLGLRFSGVNFNYYCWDEHDYIAHNIYNRTQVQSFEVPYSNKWPLGHLLIYMLVLPFDPFQISAYRIATTFIDALTIFVLAWILWKKFSASYLESIGFALFASLAISVCLKSSLGIIAESISNLFLVSGLAFILTARGAFLKSFLAVGLFCCACWVKPTAFFPALGIVLSYLFVNYKCEKSLKKELIFLSVSSLIFLFISLLIYSSNSFGIKKYFLNSAIIYNLSFSQYKTSNIIQKLDFLFSGVAFFQFLFPLLIIYGVWVFSSRQFTNWIIHGFLVGSLASLLIRMDGGQTTYWIYALPPLLIGSFLCLLAFHKILKTNLPSLTLWLCVISTLLYGWAQNIYGQANGIYFGGKGGLRIEQTQVSGISNLVNAIQQDKNYIPKKSRLFLWGMPWQIFYFSKTVPSSSILTYETFKYGIPMESIQQILFNSINKSDFAVIENGEYNSVAMALRNFEVFFQDDKFTAFRQIKETEKIR